MSVLVDEAALGGGERGSHAPRLAAFDRGFRIASFASAMLVLLLLAGILGAMLYGGWPAFERFGFAFVTGSVWDVTNDQYGAWPAIAGTLGTALIALVIGAPISLGIAVFL